MHTTKARMLLTGPGACLIALFAIGLQQVTPAFACNPGRSNNGNYYYDGFQVTGLGTIGGVYSTNLVYTPYTYYGTTEVYDKLYNTGNAGTLKAFIEWAYDGTSLTDEFGFYTPTCSCVETYGFSSDGSGQHNTYTVLYNSCGSGEVSFYKNGTKESAFGAPSGCYPIGFIPNGAAISGGMSTLADQMPGGTQNKETLNSANEYSNGAWYNFYPYAVHTDNGQYSGGDYFGWDAFSSQPANGDIYDNSCSS